MKYLMGFLELQIWPQVSLVMFLVMFTTLVLYAMRRRAKSHYEYMADLVLDDGGQAKGEEQPHGGR